VLSDGKDTSSTQKLSDVLDRVKTNEGAEGSRIFTVAYGDEADEDLLKNIANTSNALYMKGNAGNIDKIYHQISAYF
jgi:Ca-activated chloride channel family protein